MANDNKLVNLADLKEAFDDVKESIPSKTSQLTNDSGYITGYTETDPTVPSWAKASSKPSYSASEVGAKSTQSAVNSPTASGTALAFIDTISQNAQGVITPTKKTVAGASQSAAGLMSATDKTKLDGIASGAQVNSITGVKGNSENSYRTGNVNLTPANIGAVNKAGDTMTGDLTVQHSGDTFVRVKNTDTGALVYLDSASNGKHGLWSDGYWNGSAPVSNGKFIISRNTDGKVTVADHYDKDEVDAKFTTTSVFNLFTFDSTKCDLRFAKRTGNIVQLSVYVKTGVSNGNALITKIDNSILPTQLDYVAPLYANDGKLVTSGSVWIEANNLSKISYYGSTTTVGGTATITYIIG